MTSVTVRQRNFKAFVLFFFLFLLAAATVLTEGCSKAVASPIALSWAQATVRVENENGDAGTGFLVIRKIGGKKGKVFLLTNKHVVGFDAAKRDAARFLTLYVNIRTENGEVMGTSLQTPLVQDGVKLWRQHPNPNVDVLAVDVTHLINAHPRLQSQGVDYSLFATPEILKKEQITEGDEVLVIGYPLDLYHSRINSPLVRQGIIATKIGTPIQIRFLNSSSKWQRVEIPGFLIDASILPGSSGSPVVLKPIIGRMVGQKIEMAMPPPYLLGIVSATETASIHVMKDNYFSVLAGLGIVYDVSTIRETVELFFPSIDKKNPKTQIRNP
jgi:V8-like Glu-specific endopeptidase